MVLEISAPGRPYCSRSSSSVLSFGPQEGVRRMRSGPEVVGDLHGTWGRPPRQLLPSAPWPGIVSQCKTIPNHPKLNEPVRTSRLEESTGRYQTYVQVRRSRGTDRRGSWVPLTPRHGNDRIIAGREACCVSTPCSQPLRAASPPTLSRPHAPGASMVIHFCRNTSPGTGAVVRASALVASRQATGESDARVTGRRSSRWMTGGRPCSDCW